MEHRFLFGMKEALSSQIYTENKVEGGKKNRNQIKSIFILHPSSISTVWI